MGSARKLLQESEHDLLLCDRHLPDGDGWTLLSETELSQGSIYAVAMSADASKQDVKMATAAGYAEYMPKPFGGGNWTGSCGTPWPTKRLSGTDGIPSVYFQCFPFRYRMCGPLERAFRWGTFRQSFWELGRGR